MKLRILVEANKTFLEETEPSMVFLFPFTGAVKPLKLQYSHANEWGNYVDWHDVEIKIEGY